MTDNGFEIPPVQKASHILSTCDFNSPVIIYCYCCFNILVYSFKEIKYSLIMKMPKVFSQTSLLKLRPHQVVQNLHI